MARGIRTKSFDYEVDRVDNQGTVVVAARMLLKMDIFNVGNAATKINESSSTAVKLEAHITMSKNEKEFGIHPRYALCEYTENAIGGNCYGVTPKRIVRIPILTLAQFTGLSEYDFEAGGVQANTTL